MFTNVCTYITFYIAKFILNICPNAYLVNQGGTYVITWDDVYYHNLATYLDEIGTYASNHVEYAKVLQVQQVVTWTLGITLTLIAVTVTVCIIGKVLAAKQSMAIEEA